MTRPPCEACGKEPRFGLKRYRCSICKRFVCTDCCEAIDRTKGQRRVWCLPGILGCDEIEPKMPEETFSGPLRESVCTQRGAGTKRGDGHDED